jgi:hypothetical protein
VGLSSRLQRLEQRVGDGCPACRDRRGRVVLVTSRSLPDGTVAYPEGEPGPCEHCGVVPEQVIEIVETVVETRQDLARLEAEAGPSFSRPIPSHRRAELP